MSISGSSGTDEAALGCKSRNTVGVGAADWLVLAAAPTFAIMALLTAAFGSATMCTAMHGDIPLSGMVPMYLLMSAFHASPWLKLFSRRNG